MMKVNSKAHSYFNSCAAPFFGNEVCALNSFFGEAANLVRKQVGRVDVSSYLYIDKPQHILAKKNVEAIRR